MSRVTKATKATKLFLAGTLALFGGCCLCDYAQAVADLMGSGDSQAGQSVSDSGQSNWTTSSPAIEPKISAVSAPVTTPESTSVKTMTSKLTSSDGARLARRKLPSAVEMLKRFQKGGNPSEVVISDDDSDAPAAGQDKDASDKNLNPSFVQNFGPRGLVMPGSSVSGRGIGDTTGGDAGVNKEPPVAPESPAVTTAVHNAYACVSKGKMDEALKIMAAIERKEPKSMLAHRASAFIMLSAGNGKESLDQLFALAALPNYQPQSFDRCTLGDAYLLLDRPDSALTAYEDALRINSDNLQAKSGQLRSMALVGRVDEALLGCVRAYKKAKRPPVQRYYRDLYLSLAEARSQL